MQFLHANKKKKNSNPSELCPVSTAGEEIDCFLKGETPTEAEVLPAWVRASPSERDFLLSSEQSCQHLGGSAPPPPSSAAWICSRGSHLAQVSTRDNVPVWGGKKGSEPL